MQPLVKMPSSSISDDAILNTKNEGDHMIQSSMKTLQIKVSSMKDPSKQAMINKKLNDVKLLISNINEAAKQNHAEIDQEFDEMQTMLDEEIKKQNQKIIKRNCVSRIFQFGSLNWRITVSKPGHDNNGEFNESEIDELAESMENTISRVLQNHINIENIDNGGNDKYYLNEILQQIEEDGEVEGEPDFGYDHCNNWMCYQCQHINPVTSEDLIQSNRKCINCGSNGWPTKQEMDQMMKNSCSQIRF